MHMNEQRPFETLFTSGSRWLRADVHLHTEADGEFSPIEEEVSFKKAYISRLNEESIHLGIITNHNKFNLNEFKSLKCEAQKKDILLLPGVELGVQGGAGGIHILICFDPATWLQNDANEDFINRFLDSAFEQTPNRESNNTNCQWTLSQTLKKLKEHQANGRGAFVIPAHVDETKGLLKEVGGALHEHFNQDFQDLVLGFQKVRSRDNWNNLSQWLKCDWKPARLEGSDCKSLDQVGVPQQQNEQAKQCWIKLGELSFSSLKLALRMHAIRIKSAATIPSNAYVNTMRLEGQLIKDKSIHFSPDMNNLIGIRGSGKSSILECLRYGLDIHLGESSDVADYKRALVERTLGSGGKITLEITTPDNTHYTVERVLGESPKVSQNGTFIPNLRPNSLGVIRARYFGQKDLVKFSEKGFTRELVSRFTESKGEFNEEINQIINQIEQRILSLNHSQTQIAGKEELEADLAEINVTLEKFAKHQLADKLKAQIALEKDLRHSNDLIKKQAESIASLEEWVNDQMDLWPEWLDYTSASNQPIFHNLTKNFHEFPEAIEKVRSVLVEMRAVQTNSNQQHQELQSHYESQKESFAETRRLLNLPQDLSPDSYITLNKKKSATETKLKEISKIETNNQANQKAIQQATKELQDCWLRDFKIRQKDVKKLSQTKGSPLQIILQFKGNKQAFLATLKGWIKGFQSRTLEKIATKFADGIEIYHDISHGARTLQSLNLSEDQIQKIKSGVNEHLSSILTYSPPDLCQIDYKSKPLHEHSLGQRATALIIFLLAQKDDHLLIIDQPEDDLDNQTLYSEVIQRLIELKGCKQIVFATHSPNIPILGDAEQVFHCNFSPDSIHIEHGTIDTPTMQRKIVNVLEGGDDAFRKRKQIYSSWTPSNS